MSARVSLGLMLCALLLGGCAHTPEPHYYVLSGPSSTPHETLRDGPVIGLGPLSLPDYLDRPQIVMRAGAARLTLSSQHRWAEPLSASFARALLTNLEDDLPGRDIALHPWRGSLDIARQVRVDVTRFDTDAGGSFRLSARWSVSTSDDKQPTSTRHSDIEVPVSGKDDDYDALVAAANSAVAALAKSIAIQLQAP